MRRFATFLALLILVATPARAASDDLAVIISIKSYDHAGEVKFAHRDGEAVKDALIRVVGIPKERILERRDPGLAALRALFGTASRPGEIASHLPRRKAKRLWVYFSGHGVPGPGADTGTFEPYLLPRDGQPASLGFTALRLAEIEATLDAIRRNFMAPDATVVLVLEACFSGKSEAGELVKETSVGPFSVPPRTGGGLVVLSAAQASELASWDRNAEQGLFTDILVDALFGEGRADTKGPLTLEVLDGLLQRAMPGRLATLFQGQGRIQRPRLEGPNEAVLADGKARPRDPGRAEDAALKCNAYQHLQDPALIERFVQGCRACTPECRATLSKRVAALVEDQVRCRRETETVAELARLGDAGRPALASLKGTLRCPAAMAALEAALAQPGGQTPGAAVADKAPASGQGSDPSRGVTPGSGQSFKDRLADGKNCTFCPEMVVVPAGAFDMGSNEDDSQKPVRRVTIRQPFAVGKFEVTFAEWDACHRAGGCTRRPDDPGWGRGRRPVIKVSWDDAKQYVAWLAKTTGKGYRLLTEAEWEYAARAGTTTRYHFGDSDSGLGDYAWYGANSGNKTQPVGGKAANAWGLHDMHGNAWEWVEDCWHDNYQGAPTDGSAWTSGSCVSRVFRGGSGNSIVPHFLRAANRSRYLPVSSSNNLGLRVARTLNP